PPLPMETDDESDLSELESDLTVALGARSTALDELRRCTDERDKLRVTLEETQRDRERIRGELGGMEQAWLNCKRQFALARLGWFTQRVADDANPNVTVRFAQYSDYGRAQEIERVFK